ncbi:MAG: site-2 protease family protein [Chloroflexota bacterium]|nr:site-2 protease family protein [Chloroflexota bacterium]
MLRAFKIGHLYGIDVNVHPTFGLVVVWAVWQWGLSSSRGFGAFALGLLLVTLVFASVLLHELGHCAMARQFGIRVLDITLWPFGGVARIEQLPAEPRSEFLISVAGPATNLAIAVALLPPILLTGVLAGWDSLFSTSDPLGSMTPATLLSYLAIFNLFILAFNLLPAFPVDGGRMLRAALSPGLGRDRATSIAVAAGLVFAALFAIVGIWQLNPVLIVTGLFIFFAAQAEARVERVQSAMRRLKVGQYALWDMGGISPREPLTFALRGGPRDMAVTERGQVLGMLWRSHLLDGLAGGVAGRTVSDVMDRSVYIADINDSIYDVQLQMNKMNRWAVPVTESGRYRGIFTADRFVHLNRQIAPGLLGNTSISAEWREAIVETLSSWKHYRRR